MLGPARIYFFIFGVLTIAGGVIGYVKAQSVPSIIAGSIAGILLLVAGCLLPQHRIAGLVLGGIVSVLLLVQFAPKFFGGGKMMPAGLMTFLSLLGIVAAVSAWLKE